MEDEEGEVNLNFKNNDWEQRLRTFRGLGSSGPSHLHTHKFWYGSEDKKEGVDFFRYEYKVR